MTSINLGNKGKNYSVTPKSTAIIQDTFGNEDVMIYWSVCYHFKMINIYQLQLLSEGLLVSDISQVQKCIQSWGTVLSLSICANSCSQVLELFDVAKTITIHLCTSLN